jgi:hypothetical protein
MWSRLVFLVVGWYVASCIKREGETPAELSNGIKLGGERRPPLLAKK